MRLILLLIIFSTYFGHLDGQNAGFEIGLMSIPQKSISDIELHPDIRADQSINTSENFYKITYEQRIWKKIFLMASYSRSKISTSMNFDRGEDVNVGFGWTGTDISRIDLNVMYNLFSERNFILQPHGGIGFLRSNPESYAYFDPIMARMVFQGSVPEIRVNDDPAGMAYSNSQLVPVVGLKFGYAFWGRLELFVNLQGTFGHKVIQDLTLFYRYNQEEQPAVTNFADGSGWFFGYGIGYRFGKHPRKKK